MVEENEIVKIKPSACRFFGTFKSNKVHRRNIIVTVTLCLSFAAFGWVVLQIGTALPDLQILVDVDLETASWLFTTWSLGFVTGSLFCGFLYDRINRLVIMFICTLGVGICSIFLPQSKSFSVMLILRIASGIFCGGIDTGANTIIPSIWGGKAGPYMQALYLSYTVGSIAVPFVTEPFLSGSHKTLHNNNNNTGNTNILQNKSKIHTDVYIPLNFSNSENMYDASQDHSVNNTSSYNNITSDSVLFNTSSFSNTSMSDDGIEIHKAFIMTCALVLCSSLPYLVMILIGDFDVKADTKTAKDGDTEKEVEPLREKSEINDKIKIDARKIEGKRKYCVLTCIACVNLLYGATEDSLGDFLVTFALDFLQWDTSAAVSLISLYWVASCIGGLAGIVLVRCLKTTKLLFIAHLFWISTFLLSLLASLYKINAMIWIFIPSSGFFMVLIIPSAISWTEENVCHITGRISSLFMIATGTGLTANPGFLGYMMEEHSYVSFLCILFIESVICFGFYVLAYTFRYARYKSDDAVKATLIK